MYTLLVILTLSTLPVNIPPAPPTVISVPGFTSLARCMSEGVHLKERYGEGYSADAQCIHTGS